ICHCPFVIQCLKEVCPVLPLLQNVAAGNVFSNCAGGNFNLVNNSCNPVTYFEPSMPCINTVCGLTNTQTADVNKCEDPCCSCTYEFDYDLDPPIIHGHRLASESLHSSSPESTISIYPNPANNNFSINFGKIEMPCSITIYDMKGQLITSFEATESVTEVNTDKYVPGIYVVKIENNDIGMIEIQKIQIIK